MFAATFLDLSVSSEATKETDDVFIFFTRFVRGL